MIQSLDKLASGKYEPLFTSFHAIEDEINSILARKKDVRDERLVIPMSDIDMGMSDLVGGKMANLGEMKHQDQPVTTLELDNYETTMRENPRKPCLIKVQCHVQNRSFNSYIIDISTVGVFIETTKNFSVGQKMALKFNIPKHQHPLRLNGVIAWNGLQGIGVKFSRLNNSQEKIISAFVNQR